MIRFKQTGLKRKEVKPARSVLIDIYINGFMRRETKTERPGLVFFNYFTLICYMVTIVKLLVCFMPLSRTTKLILFDPGLLFGGIEIYSRLFFLCGVSMGVVCNITMRITKGSAYREWTFVFKAARNRSLIVAFGERNVLAKMVKFMRILYMIMDISLISVSKYFYYQKWPSSTTPRGIRGS